MNRFWKVSKRNDSQWRFTVYESGVSDGEIEGLILSNGEEQCMVIKNYSEITYFKPNKEDCVNSLTRIFAPIHGRAIQNGGILDDIISD